MSLYSDWRDLPGDEGFAVPEQLMGGNPKTRHTKKSRDYIAYFKKTTLDQVQAINWKQQLAKEMQTIVNTVRGVPVFKVNKEYAANMKRASTFAKGLLQQSQIDLETFFFAVLYFFFFLDEEHTFLQSFKYDTCHRRLDFVPVYAGGVIRDMRSKMQVTLINNRPPKDYFDQIAAVFPLRQYSSGYRISECAQHLNIYNPFFFIESVTLEGNGKQKELTTYKRFVDHGYLAVDTFDQRVIDMPADLKMTYVPCDSFRSIQWDRDRLRSEASQRELIVIDLRNNGGGSIYNVFCLIEDLATAFCDQSTIRLLQKEFAAFLHCSRYSAELLYDIFLYKGASTAKIYIKEQAASDRCRDKITRSKALSKINQIVKQMIGSGQWPPVIAVLINSKCFSACRDAAMYLSALPNTVIVGQEMHIKSAVAYMPGLSTVTTDTLTFQVGQIINVDSKQRYTKLKPHIPSALAGSSLRHSLELYAQIEDIKKIVIAKTRKPQRKSIFTPW